MTENETDYSDYIQHMSNNLNGLFLYSGFTMTAMTVLITTLPNIKSVMAQITLFFLFALLNTFTLLIAEIGVNNLFLCRNIPPLTTRLRRFNTVFLWTQGMWGIALILMFLLSDLPYLALFSTLVYAVELVIAGQVVLRSFDKRRRLRSQKIEPNST
jgi:hypothetical protein